MASVLLNLLFIVAISSAVQGDLGFSKKKPHPPGGRAATFYYLVRQWPETFCEVDGCTRQPQSEKWTIHGLWPNYNKDGYPTNCPGPKFDDQDISGLLPQLRSEWPSYKGGDEQFWEHEYNKHGTCNINGLSEEQYFQTGLDLNGKYPILAEDLKAANIVPSESATYATSDLVEVLARKWGATPVVKCSRPRQDRLEDDAPLIDSIFICIDPNLQIGECAYDCEGEGCEYTNCDSFSYPPLGGHGRLGAGTGNTSSVGTA